MVGGSRGKRENLQFRTRRLRSVLTQCCQISLPATNAETSIDVFA